MERIKEEVSVVLDSVEGLLAPKRVLRQFELYDRKCGHTTGWLWVSVRWQLLCSTFSREFGPGVSLSCERHSHSQAETIHVFSPVGIQM